MLSIRSVRRNICSLMKKLGASASDSKSCNKRLVNDAETKSSGKVRVARRCVAIYVGEERQRYQVPVKYLSWPRFQELIKRSQQDVLDDAKIDGPITIACPTQTFDRLLKIAKKMQY